jgi:hypothetical protein
VTTAMFSAVSAWWSMSFEWFIHIHKSNYFAVVVVSVFMGIIVKMLEFFRNEERSKKLKKM